MPIYARGLIEEDMKPPANAPANLSTEGEDGRGSRARTRDLRFWRPPLYQLSYTPAPLAAAFLFLLVPRRKSAITRGGEKKTGDPKAARLFYRRRPPSITR